MRFLFLLIVLNLNAQIPGLIFGGGGSSGGSGITNLTTGSSDPVGACTNVSTSNLTKYYQTTAHTLWSCINSVWAKDIIVNPAATLEIVGNVGTDPCGTVAASTSCFFSDSANSNHWSRKDDSQVVHDLESSGGSGGAIILGQTTSEDKHVDGSGTKYVPLFGPLGFFVLESAISTKIRRTGTAKNLCLSTNIYDTQPSDGDLVVTLRIGSVDTLLVATVPANATSGTQYCDTTHTVAISSGDVIDLKAVNGSASNSVQISGVYMELQ